MAHATNRTDFGIDEEQISFEDKLKRDKKRRKENALILMKNEAQVNRTELYKTVKGILSDVAKNRLLTLPVGLAIVTSAVNYGISKKANADLVAKIIENVVKPSDLGPIDAEKANKLIHKSTTINNDGNDQKTHSYSFNSMIHIS